MLLQRCGKVILSTSFFFVFASKMSFGYHVKMRKSLMWDHGVWEGTLKIKAKFLIGTFLKARNEAPGEIQHTQF